MASNKFRYPPAPANGQDTFSDNLVGFQVVDGGGLTQGNFEFSTSVVEKVNRTFNLGAFSGPISLDDLDVTSDFESREIAAKNLGVYPNFDVTQVMNYNMYGSLVKRFEVSVTKVINYFPAAIQIDSVYYDFTTANTATNISFDSIDNTTTFDLDVTRFKNPFDIDYSQNSDRNLSVRPMEVAPIRNLTREFEKYSLYVSNVNTEYPIIDFIPSVRLSAGTVTITVAGNPFSGNNSTTLPLVVKPNSLNTEKAFSNNFDELEKFLLNRMVVPKYTSKFQIIEESDSGKLYKIDKSVTWPTDGLWNLDIRTNRFNIYIESLQEIGENLDDFKTDLIVRFLTTGAFKEFDTEDQRVTKILRIYGRAFDELKKFVDTLAYMNSVNYNVKNDIPSQLLKNLAATLGYNTNVSPITNDAFLNSVFGQGTPSVYPGQTVSKTPDEINFQFYRNLILNAAYLFKSKGTRRSVEFLLRMAGAPKALIEFNETIYMADGPINLNRYNYEWSTISGGTKAIETPILDPNNLYQLQGVQYTGFTTSTSFSSVTITQADIPMDAQGYPKKPVVNNSYFFQKGAGWFELTPDHRSPLITDDQNSVFTGQNPNVQTEFEPFTYGEKYVDRYKNFPFLNPLGFGLTRIYDNKKSWVDNQTGLRRSRTGGYNAYYYVEDERLVLNRKNIDLYLNMGQGILYDIWTMSNKYDYPFPSTGLTAPYPSPKGVDWTVINPRPQEKTFFEFAQTFYNNMINVRNRQWITDGKNGGYPALQSIYWKYLQSQQTVNIPSNQYTYQKMIDFTLGLGPYWMRLVEQVIPATTIWLGGQKMENNVLNRQKFAWRRQRGCEIIPIPCIPCEYNGQLFGYDCIDQTLNCDVEVNEFGAKLATALKSCAGSSGFTISNCDLNSVFSEWYVDVRLDNVILVQQKFYTGYGIYDYPTQTDWYNALDTYLDSLYQSGLNYYRSGNNLVVSNSTCLDNFRESILTVNIGINVSLTC